MKQAKFGIFSTILTLCLMGWGPPLLNAQESDKNEFTLEEITVTAEKRATNLQDTSISISALTNEDIQSKVAVSVEDLLRDIPNLEIQVSGRGFQVAIRGVGSDLNPNIGESSVSTNFDGVYNYRSEAGIIGYFDLDRVEVLRGPQGMLYGRNATAGVVNVIMKEPGDEFTGYTSIGVGNYRLMRTEGAINVPLNDDFSMRVSFANVNRDGYLSNGMNDAKAGSIRTKLRYQPNDDFKMILTHQYIKLGGMSWGSVDKDSFDSGRDKLYDSTPPYGSQNVAFHRAYANIELTAGPGIISFLPSIERGDGKIRAYSNFSGGMETQYQPKDGKQYSAELRYSSKGDAKIQWVTGLYYYDVRKSDIGGNNPLETTAWTKSYAAFGQLTYPFTDKLRGIVGARESKDDKGYDNPNLVNLPQKLDDSWKAFDWKTGLEYDFAEDTMGYLSLSTGHRPGGFNKDASEMPIRFEMEEVLSAEVGVKSRFLENRMQLNGSVYYYDYADYQVSDFFMPAGATEPEANLYNCDSVLNYGAEVELSALIGSSTELDITGTYLHTEYQADLILHSGAESANLKGETLPHSPKLSFSGSIKHTFLFADGGTLTPSVTVKWTDDQLVRPYPGETETQEAYTNIDATMAYNSASQRWSMNFFLRNATNEITKKAFFGQTYNVSDPRQAGVSLSLKF